MATFAFFKLLRTNNESEMATDATTMEENKKGTLYDRLLLDLEQNEKTKNEVASGRRLGFYRLKSGLGSGTFAQVKLGVHLLTNETVAVKILDKTKMDGQLVSREISCLDRLCHENVIRLFEIHDSHLHMSLVMECAAEGNLQSRVEDNGPFSEDDAREVFSQMAAGVQHMHSNGVTHRDLKPENILYVSKTRVKIADFGFSTPTTDTLLSTFCGSPAFAAPELLEGEKQYMGPPVDMWALGITLYYIVTGNVPFVGNGPLEVKESVIKGSYIVPTRVGSVCTQLIADLLVLDPSKRLVISDVLQHQWLKLVEDQADDSDRKETPASNDDEIDRDIVAQMKQLGVPVNDENLSCVLRLPDNAIAGTYRILLHQKQNQPTKPPTPPPPPPSTATATTETRARRLSKTCIIL